MKAEGVLDQSVNSLLKLVSIKKVYAQFSKKAVAIKQSYFKVMLYHKYRFVHSIPHTLHIMPEMP